MTFSLRYVQDLKLALETCSPGKNLALATLIEGTYPEMVVY